VWWVGPLIGAIAAAIIYRYVLEFSADEGVSPGTPEG
jgi:hypothetical protein